MYLQQTATPSNSSTPISTSSSTNPRHDRPSLAKFWDTHLHVEKAELFGRARGAEAFTVPEGAFRRPEGKWGLGRGFGWRS